MPSPRAQIHEVVCAGVACSACAAANTMATELVMPTSTATKPAVKEASEVSRNNEGRGTTLTMAPTSIALSQGCAQISTLEPSSTTRFVGRFRKSAAEAALRCMLAKSFSRQKAMPAPMVGMTMSRLRK